MLVVENTYISDDVIENFFVCDLEKCKGACCVEGHLGAPLEEEELPKIEAVYEKVKPYLTPEAIKVIDKEGLYIKDHEGDYSTSTINDQECVFAYYDEKGFLKCGIETAYLNGEIDFIKPISCHLYPIRITKLDIEEALNYHRWQICSPACGHGKALGVPLYKFLKTPLVRRYGEDWYKKLEQQVAAREADK
ncbi:DUF3109 family protein [Microscilla marina]|uniref:DUF3109 family protein n=1 Tax=Microscilla marina ATCC 23134 TaxID=313606 RepID=A1ZZK5_MICM2|nr:DUF3109 family protein [Microscilla marina]EAY24200.1 conserved hypothetical protein [Microscilla marina ATCC 23134]